MPVEPGSGRRKQRIAENHAAAFSAVSVLLRYGAGDEAAHLGLEPVSEPHRLARVIVSLVSGRTRRRRSTWT